MVILSVYILPVFYYFKCVHEIRLLRLSRLQNLKTIKRKECLSYCEYLGIIPHVQFLINNIALVILNKQNNEFKFN